MATLPIKGIEFELNFSIMLDKALNKQIKDDEDMPKGKQRLSGGIAKVLPQLIEMDIETLAQVFEVAMKIAPKDRTVKATFDDILEAIDARMNEDDDATKIFAEVFEAIDQSAFSRNELVKFAENMKLVKEMRTDELDEQKAAIMVKRLNTNYLRITGKTLIDETMTA